MKKTKAFQNPGQGISIEFREVYFIFLKKEYFQDSR